MNTPVDRLALWFAIRRNARQWDNLVEQGRTLPMDVVARATNALGATRRMLVLWLEKGIDNV